MIATDKDASSVLLQKVIFSAKSTSDYIGQELKQGSITDQLLVLSGSGKSCGILCSLGLKNRGSKRWEVTHQVLLARLPVKL